MAPAFPPFSRTALAFLRMTLDGSFARAYASTLQPLLIGIAISAALGVGAGVAMGLSRSVEWLTLPLFVIAQAAPMAAIIPMITYVYGIGLTAKVLAVTVLVVPVIAMNSYKGIRNTSPSLLEMCRSFLGDAGAGGLEDRFAVARRPHLRGTAFGWPWCHRSRRSRSS